MVIEVFSCTCLCRECPDSHKGRYDESGTGYLDLFEIKDLLGSGDVLYLLVTFGQKITDFVVGTLESTKIYNRRFHASSLCPQPSHLFGTTPSLCVPLVRHGTK